MACKKCGNCCRYYYLHPKGFNFDFEWAEIQKGIVAGDYVFFPAPCPKLEGNECSIYENRPKFCKWWPGPYDEVDLEYLKALGCTILD